MVTEGRSFRSQSTDQRLQRASRRVVYSKSAMDADYEFPSFPKSTEKRHLLTESLFDNFFLFKELSEELKAKMVDALEMQKLNLREVVMKQGEKGDFMYVVERGRLEVLIDDVKVKSIGPGEVMVSWPSCTSRRVLRQSDACRPPAMCGKLGLVTLQTLHGQSKPNTPRVTRNGCSRWSS